MSSKKKDSWTPIEAFTAHMHRYPTPQEIEVIESWGVIDTTYQKFTDKLGKTDFLKEAQNLFNIRKVAIAETQREKEKKEKEEKEQKEKIIQKEQKLLADATKRELECYVDDKGKSEPCMKLYNGFVEAYNKFNSKWHATGKEDSELLKEKDRCLNEFFVKCSFKLEPLTFFEVPVRMFLSEGRTKKIMIIGNQLPIIEGLECIKPRVTAYDEKGRPIKIETFYRPQYLTEEPLRQSPAFHTITYKEPEPAKKLVTTKEQKKTLTTKVKEAIKPKEQPRKITCSKCQHENLQARTGDKCLVCGETLT